MNGNFKFYNLAKILVIPILKKALPYEVIGAENIPTDGPAIIYSKHIGFLDPVMIASATNRWIHYFATREVFLFPLNLIFRNLGCMPIDRMPQDKYKLWKKIHGPEINTKMNRKSIKEGYKKLRTGELVGIFPEAHRVRPIGAYGNFEPGGIKLAQTADVNIIPVYINRIKVGRYFRTHTQIIIGKSFKVERRLPGEEATELAIQKIKQLEQGK